MEQVLVTEVTHLWLNQHHQFSFGIAKRERI